MATEDITAQVLGALSESNGSLLSTDAFPSIPSNIVKSALDRLGSREMVISRAIDREVFLLLEEGKEIATHGSHEAKVFEAVRQAVDGLKIADLPVCIRILSEPILIYTKSLTLLLGYCWQGKRQGWSGQGIRGEVDQERRPG